ncbi:MAG: tetratricopeptide repeat protein [Candidatus Glassbacteria bacterium]|nr:tetratricopeptide repeat protein [Candidatus Glassbacteria bacterium]
MKVKLLSLPALIAVLVSCSAPSAPEYNPLPSYYQEVSRGWSFFDQDNYALAAASFRKAIENDTDNTESEALVGLAWSLALQDSLVRAVSSYQSALARNPESPKPLIYVLSGLSLCYRDLEPPDNEAVKDYARAALEIDENFVFEHKSSINAQDLIAVLAEAYFNLEQYDSAAVYADPQGTLDPAAEDYQEKLLAKINSKLRLEGR